MAIRKFYLTKREICELSEAIHQADLCAYRSRLEAVLLYGTGCSVSEITRKCDITRSSLLNWCRDYKKDGVHALEDRRQGGNNSYLETWQYVQLKKKLTAYTPADIFGRNCATADGKYWTVEDVYRAVRTWYQVVYRNRKSYHNLMERLGFQFDPNTRVFRSALHSRNRIGQWMISSGNPR